MVPIDAADAAAVTIMRDGARSGTAAFRITGRRDGSLHVGTPGLAADGCGADIVINYAGDSFDLYAFGEQVSGALHTLRRVLLTRLARQAALIPANRS